MTSLLPTVAIAEAIILGAERLLAARCARDNGDTCIVVAVACYDQQW